MATRVERFGGMQLPQKPDGHSQRNQMTDAGRAFNNRIQQFSGNHSRFLSTPHGFHDHLDPKPGQPLPTNPAFADFETLKGDLTAFFDLVSNGTPTEQQEYVSFAFEQFQTLASTVERSGASQADITSGLCVLAQGFLSALRPEHFPMMLRFFSRQSSQRIPDSQFVSTLKTLAVARVLAQPDGAFLGTPTAGSTELTFQSKAFLQTIIGTLSPQTGLGPHVKQTLEVAGQYYQQPPGTKVFGDFDSLVDRVVELSDDGAGGVTDVVAMLRPIFVGISTDFAQIASASYVQAYLANPADPAAQIRVRVFEALIKSEDSAFITAFDEQVDIALKGRVAANQDSPQQFFVEFMTFNNAMPASILSRRVQLKALPIVKQALVNRIVKGSDHASFDGDSGQTYLFQLAGYLVAHVCGSTHDDIVQDFYNSSELTTVHQRHFDAACTTGLLAQQDHMATVSTGSLVDISDRTHLTHVISVVRAMSSEAGQSELRDDMKSHLSAKPTFKVPDAIRTPETVRDALLALVDTRRGQTWFDYQYGKIPEGYLGAITDHTVVDQLYEYNSQLAVLARDLEFNVQSFLQEPPRVTFEQLTTFVRAFSVRLGRFATDFDAYKTTPDVEPSLIYQTMANRLQTLKETVGLLDHQMDDLSARSATDEVLVLSKDSSKVAKFVKSKHAAQVGRMITLAEQNMSERSRAVAGKAPRSPEYVQLQKEYQGYLKVLTALRGIQEEMVAIGELTECPHLMAPHTAKLSAHLQVLSDHSGFKLQVKRRFIGTTKTVTVGALVKDFRGAFSGLEKKVQRTEKRVQKYEDKKSVDPTAKPSSKLDVTQVSTAEQNARTLEEREVTTSSNLRSAKETAVVVAFDRCCDEVGIPAVERRVMMDHVGDVSNLFRLMNSAARYQATAQVLDFLYQWDAASGDYVIVPGLLPPVAAAGDALPPALVTLLTDGGFQNSLMSGAITVGRFNALIGALQPPLDMTQGYGVIVQRLETVIRDDLPRLFDEETTRFRAHLPGGIRPMLNGVQLPSSTVDAFVDRFCRALIDIHQGKVVTEEDAMPLASRQYTSAELLHFLLNGFDSVHPTPFTPGRLMSQSTLTYLDRCLETTQSQGVVSADDNNLLISIQGFVETQLIPQVNQGMITASSSQIALLESIFTRLNNMPLMSGGGLSSALDLAASIGLMIDALTRKGQMTAVSEVVVSRDQQTVRALPKLGTGLKSITTVVDSDAELKLEFDSACRREGITRTGLDDTVHKLEHVDPNQPEDPGLEDVFQGLVPLTGRPAFHVRYAYQTRMIQLYAQLGATEAQIEHSSFIHTCLSAISREYLVYSTAGSDAAREQAVDDALGHFVASTVHMQPSERAWCRLVIAEAFATAQATGNPEDLVCSWSRSRAKLPPIIRVFNEVSRGHVGRIQAVLESDPPSLEQLSQLPQMFAKFKELLEVYENLAAQGIVPYSSLVEFTALFNKAVVDSKAIVDGVLREVRANSVIGQAYLDTFDGLFDTRDLRAFEHWGTTLHAQISSVETARLEDGLIILEEFLGDIREYRRILDAADQAIEARGLAPQVEAQQKAVLRVDKSAEYRARLAEFLGNVSRFESTLVDETQRRVLQLNVQQVLAECRLYEVELQREFIPDAVVHAPVQVDLQAFEGFNVRRDAALHLERLAVYLETLQTEYDGAAPLDQGAIKDRMDYIRLECDALSKAMQDGDFTPPLVESAITRSSLIFIKAKLEAYLRSGGNDRIDYNLIDGTPVTVLAQATIDAIGLILTGTPALPDPLGVNNVPDLVALFGREGMPIHRPSDLVDLATNALYVEQANFYSQIMAGSINPDTQDFDTAKGWILQLATNGNVQQLKACMISFQQLARVYQAQGQDLPDELNDLCIQLFYGTLRAQVVDLLTSQGYVAIDLSAFNAADTWDAIQAMVEHVRSELGNVFAHNTAQGGHIVTTMMSLVQLLHEGYSSLVSPGFSFDFARTQPNGMNSAQDFLGFSGAVFDQINTQIVGYMDTLVGTDANYPSNHGGTYFDVIGAFATAYPAPLTRFQTAELDFRRRYYDRVDAFLTVMRGAGTSAAKSQALANLVRDLNQDIADRGNADAFQAIVTRFRDHVASISNGLQLVDHQVAIDAVNAVPAVLSSVGVDGALPPRPPYVQLEDMDAPTMTPVLLQLFKANEGMMRGMHDILESQPPLDDATHAAVWNAFSAEHKFLYDFFAKFCDLGQMLAPGASVFVVKGGVAIPADFLPIWQALVDGATDTSPYSNAILALQDLFHPIASVADVNGLLKDVTLGTAATHLELSSDRTQLCKLEDVDYTHQDGFLLDLVKANWEGLQGMESNLARCIARHGHPSQEYDDLWASFSVEARTLYAFFNRFVNVEALFGRPDGSLDAALGDGSFFRDGIQADMVNQCREGITGLQSVAGTSQNFDQSVVALETLILGAPVAPPTFNPPPPPPAPSAPLAQLRQAVDALDMGRLHKMILHIDATADRTTRENLLTTQFQAFVGAHFDEIRTIFMYYAQSLSEGLGDQAVAVLSHAHLFLNNLFFPDHGIFSYQGFDFNAFDPDDVTPFNPAHLVVHWDRLGTLQAIGDLYLVDGGRPGIDQLQARNFFDSCRGFVRAVTNFQLDPPAAVAPTTTVADHNEHRRVLTFGAQPEVNEVVTDHQLREMFNYNAIQDDLGDGLSIEGVDQAGDAGIQQLFHANEQLLRCNQFGRLATLGEHYWGPVCTFFDTCFDLDAYFGDEDSGLQPDKVAVLKPGIALNDVIAQLGALKTTLQSNYPDALLRNAVIRSIDDVLAILQPPVEEDDAVPPDPRIAENKIRLEGANIDFTIHQQGEAGLFEFFKANGVWIYAMYMLFEEINWDDNEDYYETVSQPMKDCYDFFSNHYDLTAWITAGRWNADPAYLHNSRTGTTKTYPDALIEIRAQSGQPPFDTLIRYIAPAPRLSAEQLIQQRGAIPEEFNLDGVVSAGEEGLIELYRANQPLLDNLAQSVEGVDATAYFRDHVCHAHHFIVHFLRTHLDKGDAGITVKPGTDWQTPLRDYVAHGNQLSGSIARLLAVLVPASTTAAPLPPPPPPPVPENVFGEEGNFIGYRVPGEEEQQPPQDEETVRTRQKQQVARSRGIDTDDLSNRPSDLLSSIQAGANLKKVTRGGSTDAQGDVVQASKDKYLADAKGCLTGLIGLAGVDNWSDFCGGFTALNLRGFRVNVFQDVRTVDVQGHSLTVNFSNGHSTVDDVELGLIYFAAKLHSVMSKIASFMDNPLSNASNFTQVTDEFKDVFKLFKWLDGKDVFQGELEGFRAVYSTVHNIQFALKQNARYQSPAPRTVPNADLLNRFRMQVLSNARVVMDASPDYLDLNVRLRSGQSVSFRVPVSIFPNTYELSSCEQPFSNFLDQFIAQDAELGDYVGIAEGQGIVDGQLDDIIALGKDELLSQLKAQLASKLASFSRRASLFKQLQAGQLTSSGSSSDIKTALSQALDDRRNSQVVDYKPGYDVASRIIDKDFDDHGPDSDEVALLNDVFNKLLVVVYGEKVLKPASEEENSEIDMLGGIEAVCEGVKQFLSKRLTEYDLVPPGMDADAHLRAVLSGDGNDFNTLMERISGSGKYASFTTTWTHYSQLTHHHITMDTIFGDGWG